MAIESTIFIETFIWSLTSLFVMLIWLALLIYNTISSTQKAKFKSKILLGLLPLLFVSMFTASIFNFVTKYSTKNYSTAGLWTAFIICLCCAVFSWAFMITFRFQITKGIMDNGYSRLGKEDRSIISRIITHNFQINAITAIVCLNSCYSTIFLCRIIGKVRGEPYETILMVSLLNIATFIGHLIFDIVYRNGFSNAAHLHYFILAFYQFNCSRSFATYAGPTEILSWILGLVYLCCGVLKLGFTTITNVDPFSIKPDKDSDTESEHYANINTYVN